jgi:hypothetical protein
MCVCVCLSTNKIISYELNNKYSSREMDFETISPSFDVWMMPSLQEKLRISPIMVRSEH